MWYFIQYFIYLSPRSATLHPGGRSERFDSLLHVILTGLTIYVEEHYRPQQCWTLHYYCQDWTKIHSDQKEIISGGK